MTKVWNNLPHDLISAPNIAMCSKLLKNFNLCSIASLTFQMIFLDSCLHSHILLFCAVNLQVIYPILMLCFFFPYILMCFDLLPSTIVLYLNVSAMPLTVDRKIAFRFILPLDQCT